MKLKSYRIDLHFRAGETKEFKAIGHSLGDGMFVLTLDNKEIHFFPIETLERVVVHPEFFQLREEMAKAAQAAEAAAREPRIRVPDLSMVSRNGQSS